MFSTIKKIALAAVLVSTTSFAQSKQNLVQEISELTRKIRQETAQTDISESKLIEIRTLLEDALDVAQDGADYNAGCFNYVFEKYNQSYSSGSATEKAALACKTIQDVSVVKYSYEKYNQSYSSGSAMDKAAALASGNVKGKSDMLQFAYEMYNQSYSSGSAMDKAGNVAKVKRGFLQCLKDMYSKYNQSYSSGSAMDKTIEACSQ